MLFYFSIYSKFRIIICKFMRQPDFFNSSGILNQKQYLSVRVDSVATASEFFVEAICVNNVKEMTTQSLLVFAIVIVGVTAGSTAGRFSGGGDSSKPVGVGSYAFQDSSGNRYGGTYDIKPEDVPNLVYAPAFTGFQDFNYGGFPFGGEDEFFDFFKKLQSSFQEHMISRSRAVVSFDNPTSRTDSGLSRGGGAYHLSDTGYNDIHNPGQHFAQTVMQYGQGFNDFQVPDFSNMNYQHPQGANSAYAGGYIGPDGTRQVASISPTNPNNPNIDVSSRSGTGGGGDGFYSVSSSSFASSSDMGGKKTESRGAKTVINDNGRIKQYEVKN